MGVCVKSYLGTNVSKDSNITINMIEPEIINKILKNLGICDESKINDTPENVILTKDED